MRLSSDDDDTLTSLQIQSGVIRVADWAGRSSIGLVRRRNEDAWGELQQQVFAVADGMGGAAGGDRASALAIAGFLTADPSDGWLHALRQLNDEIRSVCVAEGFESAGTTLVGVVVERSRCVTISIGDSRIYRGRAGRADTITSDHNLRNLRIEEGLDPDVTDERGRPGALTAYLGSADPGQRLDVGTISVEHGDRLLLCSDGVYGQLLPKDLEEILTASADCNEAAEQLVSAADRAGGRDNATAVVIEFEVVDT